MFEAMLVHQGKTTAHTQQKSKPKLDHNITESNSLDAINGQRRGM